MLYLHNRPFVVGIVSSNGLVPIALFIILVISSYIIDNLEQRKETNNMEQAKTTIKQVVTDLSFSILTTLWAIGASVTATAVLH